MAEIDTDGEASGRVQGEENRWSSAGLAMCNAGRLRLLGKQARLDQVGDDARHRRTGEPGGPGDLRTTGGASSAERVDDAAAIELTQ
jgi:hypothetical protein